jgi:hypothetical protein
MSQDFVSSRERRGRDGNVRLADWRQWVQTMKRLVALGLAALVIASCSVPERASSETVPFAVSPSVAVATAPTTASPPSSTSTTATVAETTTLPAATTTVATEDLIKQAVQDYFEAYTVCGTTPARCSPTDFTATEGPSRAVVTEFAKGLVDQGLYFSTDRRGTYLVAESVSIDSPSQATAIYCAHDALIVLGPNGPDGLPTTVNDEIMSFRFRYDVYLDSGTWKVGGQLQQDSLGEGNLCASAD